MKKLIFGIFAVTAMLFSSCSQDEFDMPAKGEMATVSFNLDTPTLGSRAYGDGLTATTLKYAVFDLKENTKAYLGELSNTEGEKFEGKSTNVPFQLATGHTYGFIFWAGNEDAPYTLNLQDGTVTIDYDEVKANDETLDAFYAYKEHTVNGAETIKVDLYRPFTQINFGTNDLEASEKVGYTPVATKVVVSEAYKGLDLFTGDVSDPAQTVTFDYAALPEGEPFPKDGGYEYLAMAYVLVPAEQILVNTTLYHKNAEDDEYSLNVSNVPVQRNYRTNLYGSLLTDALNVEVEKQPEYGDIDQEVVSVPAGQAVMNGTTYPSLKEAIEAAEGTEATIYIAGKNYIASEELVFPARTNTKYTIVGGQSAGTRAEGETSITIDKGIYLTNCPDLTLEKIKIINKTGTNYNEREGAQLNYVTNLTVKNCEIEHCLRFLATGKVVFKGCHFVNDVKGGFDGYSLHYYSNTGSEVLVEDCIFDVVSKAIVLYSESKFKYDLTVNNCKFTASTKDDKSAIQMHTDSNNNYGTVRINNTTATNFDDTRNGGLWYEENNTTHAVTYRFDVFVDGEQVHGSNKITVNGNEVSTLAEALSSVTDGSTVQLGYGDYDAKNVDWKNKNNITIEGKGAGITNIANLDFVDANGSSITLSNLAFSPVNNSTNHTASGFRGTTKMEFNNCAINAEYHCYNGDFYFNDCEFNYNPATDPQNGGRYAIYAETSGTINCKGCTFSDTLMDKGILVYSDNNTKLGDINLTNCKFYAANQTKQNGCVEIHAEKLEQGGTVTFVNTTNNGYASLWREKNGSGNKKFYTIIVDNSTEQEATKE